MRDKDKFLSHLGSMKESIEKAEDGLDQLLAFMELWKKDRSPEIQKEQENPENSKEESESSQSSSSVKPRFNQKF